MNIPRVIDGLTELQGLVGKEVGVSDWIVVTQSMIQAFSDVTGDPQWIHLDVERAKRESPYKNTIAHGFMSLALLSQLYSKAIKIQGDFKLALNYGLNRVRFPTPVPAGSKIRGRFTLQKMENVEGGVQLTWAALVEIEGVAKPAVAAEWLFRLMTSPEGLSGR
jgi:acyl dehydratase